MFRKPFVSFLTLLLLFMTVPLHAHEATLGGSKWCVGKNRIIAAIELGASLFPEIRGIREGGYKLDSMLDEQLKQLTAEIIRPYMTEKLSVSVNDRAYPVKVDRVVLEGTLWRIWLSIDDIRFNNPENRVRIDYRLLFEETNNAHVNLAYMYQSDASADAVQKVFDTTHPVANSPITANARVWEFSIKGAANGHAAAQRSQ